MRACKTRRAHVAMVACALVALVALVSACDGDADGTRTPPTRSPSETTYPSTTAASDTTSAPTWDASYSPDQLKDFEAALARWQGYERDSEPIWAAGKVTKQAERLFQEYFVSPVWRQYVERLRTYERADVQVVGVPTVLWSKASEIATTAGRGSVSVVQCVDYSSQTVTQAGQSVEAISGPVLRTATLDRTSDHPWLLLKIHEPSLEKFRSCSEETQ